MKHTHTGNSYSLDPVLTKVPTESLDDVHPGDHLMVSSSHWLVESVSCSNKTYTAYTYSGGKVTRKEQIWKPDTFRVDYGGGADIQPAETAIKNAIDECMYHSKWAHSDEFVTMMKTGQKHRVDWQCPLVEGTQPAAISLTPFTKSKIHSLEDIYPGDHIMITSWVRQAKHLLIVDTYIKGNKYVAFTTNGSGKIERVSEKWSSKGWFRISYHGNVHSTLVSPVEAIEKAEKENHKWVSSDGFVTMMKTGKCYSLAQQCLFSPDNNIVGYTPVTPDTAVDEGDHIILRDALNMYNSVFLYKNVTDSIFAIMPSMSDQDPLYGEVDLAGYQAYRVNYKESLPPEQAQIRACSEKGEKLLRENLHDPSAFISWAKTGKQISVSPGDVGIVATQEKGLPRKPQQIAQLRPWWYEKIISTDDIQVGDHLIRSHLPYWFHCMVTERDINPVDHTEFKIIYQFRTAVEEKEASLDPSKEKLYRIKYPETLPAVTAIEKARSKLGERSFSTTIRMQFVRWAKTGSEEGIEVDFLKNETLPVSKSRIWSFGQLNQGDYLVKPGKSWFPERTHHYLVTEVHSPTTCLALESWSPSGMVGRVIETTVFFEMSHEFYRINYNCGTCFTNEVAIRKAESFKGHSTAENVWSDINRQKFVNFVKTGESEAIDESKLQDDRLLLPRRKVESASELKPGDHIERPVNSAVLEKLCSHHMIVTKVVNKRRCKVIHFGLSSGNKADVLEEEVDIFVKECSFCIHYSERIDPEESITILRHQIRSEQVGCLFISFCSTYICCCYVYQCRQ